MTHSERSSVPALSRGIRVLRLLAKPTTLEDLVRQSGLPRSSVQRILATLLEEGLITKDPETKIYRTVVAHPGHDAALEDELQSELEAAMLRLAEEAGHTVEWFLPTETGHVLARREVPADAAERVHSWIGLVHPWAGQLDAVNCISRAWWSRFPEEGETIWAYGPEQTQISLNHGNARLKVQEALVNGYAEDEHANDKGIRRAASIVWGNKMPLGCLAIAYSQRASVDEASLERNRQMLVKETWDLSILGKRIMPLFERR